MEQNVVDKLKRWAESNDSVKAVVLTSSRASGSTAPVDMFSDYDVSVYVDSLDHYKNDDWLAAFGGVLVCWPLKPQSTFDENWTTRLVIFEDRTRIDFQITDNVNIYPADYDLGYEVLVDKVDITKVFPAATRAKHFIQKPSREVFLALVNDFFWDATYVAKYLWRGDIFYSKFMESTLRSEYFERMIEWYIGSKNDWEVSTNVHGRYFPKYLDHQMWTEIKETFAGSETGENWTAFFKMVEIFTKLARELAKSLSYEYPLEQERKMVAYYRQSKEIPSQLWFE